MSTASSIALYLIALFFLVLSPTKVATGQFYIVRQGLEVKTHKNSPAFVAFELSEKTYRNKTKVVSLDDQVFDLNKDRSNKENLFEKVIGKPIRLQTMLIQKPEPATDRNISSTMIAMNQRVAPPALSLPSVNAITFKGDQIKGPIEFSGGLALTPDHHIEIERLLEGLPIESGYVNPADGSFQISPVEKRGIIVARLIDNNGAQIGEGRLNIEDMKDKASQKLIINPRQQFEPPVPEKYSSAYNAKPSVVKFEVSNNGSLNKDSVKQQEIALNEEGLKNFDLNSSTRGERIGKNLAPSVFISMLGDRSELNTLPTTTLNALRSIVADQRQVDEIDPDLPIIWGKVESDGKPLQGIKVIIEDDETILPIYLNEAYIPQADLKGTSSNGFFAFVGVPEGFHTIRGLRNFGTIAYDNVISESGKVSIALLKNSLKTKKIPIYTYDALSGSDKSAEVRLQSFDNPIQVKDGATEVLLPQIKRQSYLSCKSSAEYIPAQYLYNETSDSVLVPLIRAGWLNSLLLENKIRFDATLSTVTGFVPDENFEVELVGENGNENEALVYFDKEGKTLIEKSGVSGGGFTIFNLEPGVHEIIVRLKKSNKQFNKIFPADPAGVTVINFR